MTATSHILGSEQSQQVVQLPPIRSEKHIQKPALHQGKDRLSFHSHFYGGDAFFSQGQVEVPQEFLFKKGEIWKGWLSFLFPFYMSAFPENWGQSDGTSELFTSRPCWRHHLSIPASRSAYTMNENRITTKLRWECDLAQLGRFLLFFSCYLTGKEAAG